MAMSQLGLAEFLTELQAELSQARLETERPDLKFSMDRVTVEVDVSYTRTKDSSASAKPQFWVIESAAHAADDEAGSVHRHTPRVSVQWNRRPVSTEVDQSDEVASIPVLQPAPSAKAE